ncbi:uncharacterized protein L3040_009069 [Drepanopeziza brunnea f. sp. 'multigermtubi']|nr:hypothetical protein L3040_009069 [Drepanopeziza brunnea f. sp. 'multigermtubi']
MVVFSFSLTLLLALGSHAVNDYSVVFDHPPPYQLNTTTRIGYNVTASPGQSGLSLLLLQTTASDNEGVSSSNTATFAVVLQDVCVSCMGTRCLPGTRIYINTSQISIPEYKRTEAEFRLASTSGDLRNFFFCFASRSDMQPENDICSFFSDYFNMENADVGEQSGSSGESISAIPPLSILQTPTAVIRKRTLAVPIEAMTITQSSTSNLQVILRATETATPASNSASTKTTAPTTTESSTTPILAIPEPTASGSSSSSSNGGLSVGAKVGIALGVLAFALILVLVVLFLRRKHGKRSQPENVNLTEGMHQHQDSYPQELNAEKASPIAPSEAATPIVEPLSRHSALSPQEVIASHFCAAGPAAAVPRRKPIAATVARVATMRSTASTTSSSGLQSPQLPHGFEQYHDIPITYGDARHSPQVFPENLNLVRAPFLYSQEGLSAEEMERLEDEERRIDAAIAEAERRQ